MQFIYGWMFSFLYEQFASMCIFMCLHVYKR